MDRHLMDPLLGELRDRVDRLETRTTWLERVSSRLIELVLQLVKPSKERGF